MVGFPYDDLDAWRSVYPSEVFASQLDRVADGFDAASACLNAAIQQASLSASQMCEATAEWRVAEAAAVHFRSAATQAQYIMARNALADVNMPEASKAGCLNAIEKSLRAEIALARRLYDIQSHDSRIGFESSNQYYYVPLDLAEKVLNCRDLLDRWLPKQRAAYSHGS